MTKKKTCSLLVCITSLPLWGGACTVGVRPAGAVVYAPPPRAYPPPPPPRYYASPPPPRYAPPPPGYAPPPPAGYPPPPPTQASYSPPPPPGPDYPPPGPPCIDPGPQDISDRFEQAMPLSTNSATVGCMSKRDADLFLVTASPSNAGEIVRFSVRGVQEMAPAVQILNANRSSLYRESSARGGEQRGWVHVQGGTQFYVRVSQIYSDANGPYTLTLSSTPLVEPGEPNGDLERATSLKEGGSVKAFLSNAANDPSALSDWYRIDHHDGNLSLDVDMSQDVAPMVEILNANRKPVHRQSGSRGERIQVVARVPRGTYYVRVYTIYSLASAGEGDLPSWLSRPYTLSSLR